MRRCTARLCREFSSTPTAADTIRAATPCDYLTRLAQIGIPDIYCVSDTPYLSLSDEDWQAVADAFAESSRKADELYGE